MGERYYTDEEVKVLIDGRLGTDDPVVASLLEELLKLRKKVRDDA